MGTTAHLMLVRAARLSGGGRSASSAEDEHDAENGDAHRDQSNENRPERGRLVETLVEMASEAEISGRRTEGRNCSDNDEAQPDEFGLRTFRFDQFGDEDPEADKGKGRADPRKERALVGQVVAGEAAGDIADFATAKALSTFHTASVSGPGTRRLQRGDGIKTRKQSPCPNRSWYACTSLQMRCNVR